MESVVIDREGIFKYVLIRACSEDGKNSKLFLRGDINSEYHADIYDKFLEKVKVHDEFLKNYPVLKVLGGGRLNVKKGKSILAYGYSQGYGRVPSLETVEDMLRNAFPSFEISTSEDGY